MKNSFVNQSEVDRQYLASLGPRSEDDLEKFFSIGGKVNDNMQQWPIVSIYGSLWLCITSGSLSGSLSLFWSSLPLIVTACELSLAHHGFFWLSPTDSGSLWLPLALSGFNWLSLWLSPALTGSLALAVVSVALSGTNLLSYSAYTVLGQLSGPLPCWRILFWSA